MTGAARKPKQWSNPAETIDAVMEGFPVFDDEIPFDPAVAALARAELTVAQLTDPESGVLESALLATGFHDIPHLQRYLGGASKHHALLYLGLRSQLFILAD